jgi:hypothetical protein
MLWEIYKWRLCIYKYAPMQDSYSELIKLLLPEIIVEYFVLVSYKKKEMKYSIYLKRLTHSQRISSI